MSDIIVISPKTRQKCNKENRKPLVIKDFRFLLRDSVGISGFEPEQTEPKSVVLPLHHIPIPRAKIVLFLVNQKRLPSGSL